MFFHIWKNKHDSGEIIYKSIYSSALEVKWLRDIHMSVTCAYCTVFLVCFGFNIRKYI